MKTSILYICLILHPFYISAQYGNCDDALDNRTCGIDISFEIYMADGPLLYTFFASDTEVFVEWELVSVEFGDLCISLYEDCDDSPLIVSSGNYSVLFDDLVIGETYTIGIEGCFNSLPETSGFISMDNSGNQAPYFVELNVPTESRTGSAANAFCTGSTVHFSMMDGSLHLHG